MELPANPSKLENGCYTVVCVCVCISFALCLYICVITSRGSGQDVFCVFVLHYNHLVDLQEINNNLLLLFCSSAHCVCLSLRFLVPLLQITTIIFLVC